MVCAIFFNSTDIFSREKQKLGNYIGIHKPISSFLKHHVIFASLPCTRRPPRMIPKMAPRMAGKRVPRIGPRKAPRMPERAPSIPPRMVTRKMIYILS